MDHPDYIDPRLHGNCCGCPSGYGYCSEDENLCKIRGVHTGDEKICTECWNREMPNTGTKALSCIGCFLEELGRLDVHFDMTYIDDLGNSVYINGRRKDNDL